MGRGARLEVEVLEGCLLNECMTNGQILFTTEIGAVCPRYYDK